MPPPRLVLHVSRRVDAFKTFSTRSYGTTCRGCCLLIAPSSNSPGRQRPLPLQPRAKSASGRRWYNARRADAYVEGRRVISEPANYKAYLKSALFDLQRHSQRYVNVSRLQLALRGLEQTTGEETIRVGILGLAGQGRSSQKVKELVRLLLADPLKEEEEWERILAAEPDTGKPLLLRIGEGTQGEGAAYGLSNRLVRELNISSPNLNNYRLEILVLETDILAEAAEEDDVANKILVPTVEIPTSSTGRYTPVTTPVHKALVLGDGVLGAASIANLSVDTDRQIILSAVDLPNCLEDCDNLPFQATDIDLAKRSLLSFRSSVDNATAYEHGWFKSGIPEVLTWLKDGTTDNSDNLIKSPIRHLIASVLSDASRRIENEKARQLSASLASKVTSLDIRSLQDGLQFWAQDAHTELRDQLDIAFSGARWRKLSWWKLFWRVDDVSMIASDMLNQRFLVDAEKEVVYLAGRIDQAGVFKSLPTTQRGKWAYKRSMNPAATDILDSAPGLLPIKDLLDTPKDDSQVALKDRPWPLHIPTARSYLSLDTVPALQALAQKLVLQSLTTSGLTSAFAGLIYVSAFSSSLYEAGAVAALGIVWSLRRMQKKWETARAVWEGEVREEGRKAVRATEGVVGDILREPIDHTIEGAEELEQAGKAVEQAQQALDKVQGVHI